MGLIRVWKAKRRADRLMKALERAAENPDLYMDPEWQTEAAQRAADVIEVVPMPRPIQENLVAMFSNFNLSKWLNVILTAVISGAAGAAVDALQNGGGLKVAGSAALVGAGAGVVNLVRKNPLTK